MIFFLKLLCLISYLYGIEPVKEPLNIVVILHMHGPHGPLKKILLPAILFFGKIRRDFAEPLPDGAQLSHGPFTVTHPCP